MCEAHIHICTHTQKKKMKKMRSAAVVVAQYKEKRGSKDQHKQRNNKLLAELAGQQQQRQQQRRLHALVLDGPALKTSKLLQQHYKNDISIEIAERNVDQISRMVRQNTSSSTHIYQGTLAQHLRQRRRTRKFGLAYLDYMGSVTGNKATQSFPLEDISLLLKHHAANTIVLGATFSARLQAGRNAEHDSVADTILHGFLEPVIHRAGFAVVYKARVACYKRHGGAMTMAFIAVVLQRR